MALIGAIAIQITINLPDSLHLTEANLHTELAIALFQQDRISLGSASKIAGMLLKADQRSWNLHLL
jgi:predicted HTH domain antitoxin